MVNVLIADDNINFSKNLVNYVNINNNNIRIYAIATDGKEALEIINNTNNIDVIILDLKMPQYSGKEVLEKIKNKKRYEKSIIIISGENNLIQELENFELIHSVINKGTSIQEIIYKINEIIEQKEKIKKEKIIKTKIINELQYLGYNVTYKGTRYLEMAVEQVMKNKNYSSLEKEIYPVISKKCGQSVHNIKCNINRANNIMYCECEMERMKEYFGFIKDTKPKIRVIIDTIINKIQ